MDHTYQVRRVGSGRWSDPADRVEEALDRLARELGELPGPYRIRENPEPFGPERDLAGTIARIQQRMRAGDAGFRIAARGAEDWPRFAIRKMLASDGPEVLQAALSQLGVDYVWADENPKWAEGGAGAGFDCSGLVKWCYSQVGIDFPHKADFIMRDDQVTRFEDEKDLRSGDLIFYHYGRLGPGQADHIAIVAEDGMQIDASTALDAVVHRKIDRAHVLGFGYVAEVTGRH